MAVGVALGDFTAMSLSVPGIGALLTASARLFTTVKWIGAAYLVYLGIKLFRAGETLNAESKTGASSALRLGLHACLVTRLNPKGMLSFVAFFPHFIDLRAAFRPLVLIDFATLVHGVRLNRRIAAQAPLADLDDHEITPGA